MSNRDSFVPRIRSTNAPEVPPRPRELPNRPGRPPLPTEAPPRETLAELTQRQRRARDAQTARRSAERRPPLRQSIRALLATPSARRQAILLSDILGPPVGLRG